MKKFNNVTRQGDEKAIKRGKRVPDGAVNLAWVKSPKLSPENNVIIVDTSRIVAENAPSNISDRKIMYANSLGVLEDEHGNQLLVDEYPAVADVFSIDEDFSTVAGSEYKPEHILPYVHISRFFHVDLPGITMGSGQQSYKADEIKVVNSLGQHYVDESGNPRYRIRIVAASTTLPYDSVENAYRIWAFVDSDTNEDLYLTYNKVEIATNGTLKSQDINHREILNPVPYFSYRPEESDVVDPNNRKRKIYSTKPVTLKEQILNIPHSDSDGYKVYVPKKAVEDPRIFQMFRWRVKCNFTESTKIDPSKELRSIKCGMVVTNNQPHSYSPFALYNLWKSDYNATGINFVNPLQENGSTSVSDDVKKTRAYWEVNIDTITYDQLAQYDFLIWAPTADFDFSNYLGKIDYFTNSLGGTLWVDSGNYAYTTGLGITETAAINPISGHQAARGQGVFHWTDGPTIAPTDPNNVLFKADATVGGWDLNTASLDSITPFQTGLGTANCYYCQHIRSNPSDYTWVLQGRSEEPINVAVVIRKSLSTGGNVFFSTIAVPHAMNVLISHTSGEFVDENAGSRINEVANYYNYISGTPVEGAFKLMFNVALLSVKNKILDNVDQRAYSTSWSFTSPWNASWIIDGNVLTDHEKATNAFVQTVITSDDSVPTWQRKLSGKTLKQTIDDSLSDGDKFRVAKATRTYEIEFTNPSVETTTELGDGSTPMAWTTAYSPPFVVPLDIGPYIIKEEPIQGQFESGQYLQYSYPPKPYGGQVSTKFVSTAQLGQTETTSWTASGLVRRTTHVDGASDEAQNHDDDPVEVTLNWAANGDGTRYTAGAGGGRQFDYGFPNNPNGIRLYTEDNYYTMGGGPNYNWPYWGVNVRLEFGSTGEWVSFIQDFFNVLKFFGATYFPNESIEVDGVFGPVTRRAVTAYQNQFFLKQRVGIVDTETWYSIGTQIVRGQALFANVNRNTYQRFYDWPMQWIVKDRISDGLNNSQYAKKSDIVDSPPLIWETFAVQFPKAYDITGVTVVPYLEGAARDIWIGAIDVINHGGGVFGLAGYDATKAMLSPLYIRAADGEEKKIPFSTRNGDVVAITIGQDNGTGWGSSRFLGIRDIRVHATVRRGDLQTAKAQIQTQYVPITVTGSVTVPPGSDQVIKVQYNPTDTDQWDYHEYNWTGLTLANANVIGTVRSDGQLQFKNIKVTNYADTNFTYGPAVGRTGSETYYSMNENKVLNPYPESGWVVKTEGVKLLCKADKSPYGFPAFPTNLGGADVARHYASLTLNRTENDPSILMGFYDVNRKEFVIDNDGQSTLTYIEYMNRGPANIYIGLVSNYQLETKSALPLATDAPLIPYKWAMPVYGVEIRKGSQISLEALPTDLGPSDVWPLPVRTGKFNRAVTLRDRTSGPISGYLGSYQGTTVRAFYSVVEAELGGWSAIYGRPNVDIKGEHPILQDQDVIQVRQAPFLVTREPSPFPSDADPVRPTFKVYTRESLDSGWVEVPWSGIRDYNASTGYVYLKDALTSMDSNLIKVDYTSARPIYNFKQFDGNKLNLNPYPGHNRDFVGKAVYVYILPAYVKDGSGNTISNSVEDRTIRFTTDPSIFDGFSPNYNPLAVQLGVVYITSALDINSLIMLDTRRRGGGARDSLTAEEVKRLVQESVGYWDIGYGSGTAYQKGGFVIIRLPAELKAQFPDTNDIIDVIERNITLGVKFKIEDLNGNSWD